LPYQSGHLVIILLAMEIVRNDGAVAARYLRWLIALACLLVFAWAGAAPAPALRFKRLGTLATEDMSVLSMLQDRQGFVWIATLNGGLYRYDGYQSVRYANDPLDKTSLPSDRTTALFEDKAGRIWVGTREGLARFNPADGTFTRYLPLPAPGSPRLVKNIISDGGDGMWLATWAGLQHFDPASGKIVQYVHVEGAPGSLGGNSLDALALDAKGGLWIGTWPAGLDYLAPGSNTFEHFRIDSVDAPNPELNTVHSLHIDAQQRLWIGTGRGVYRWAAGTPWSQLARVPSPDTRFNRFYHDGHGALWVGTMSGGLVRWSDGSDQPEVFRFNPVDPYSLPTASIGSAMRDRAGNLWVGTFNNGIAIANMGARGFSRLLPPAADSAAVEQNNTIQAIDAAPGGRIWLGGLSGISLFNPATGRVEKEYRAAKDRPGSLASDTIYCLYQQPGGPLWVGTPRGLHRLDHPDGRFALTQFEGKAGSFINTIVPGSNGMLWIGTGDSVVHFNPKDGSSYLHSVDKGAPNNRRRLRNASAIIEDRLGRVWMGSESANGLDMLDLRSGVFRHFQRDDPGAPGLSDDSVASLHEDGEGRIWVGTGAGMSEIVTGAGGAIEFKLALASAGLGRVFAIRSEPDGKVWASTTSSLIRFDPLTGKADKYTATDGTIDSYRVGAAFLGPDGMLYFGGTAGITTVKPSQVRVESIAPQVVITDITVLNRSLARGALPANVRLDGAVTTARSLELPPEQSVFAIEFAALHFTDPSLNRYAYQLVGFDRGWVMADAAHRSATYTNLNPGNYLFKVRAANNRGLWSEHATTLSITVLPPIWKTWWFRVSAVVLAALLLAGAYQLRVRSLTRSRRQLRELVDARTRELAESNAKLAALSMTDGLTGVINRRGFDVALGEEWARASRSGEPLALAMLDVDYFKLYNDHYGHQAGDQCLRAVAQAIAAHARRPGDMAARYGGEEFVLLAPLSYETHALGMAQEICAAVAALGLPHALSASGYVTVSIGVAALVPDGSDGADALVWKADQALYRAKQEGRNRAVSSARLEPVPVPPTVPDSRCSLLPLDGKSGPAGLR
jgi:diguanylate cyclase (GGDEF)-like protein